MRKTVKPQDLIDPYEYEERAAIIEYCANLPRYEAERLAREERATKQRQFMF